MLTVDWSPDGLQLASGDDKGVIQVLGNVEFVLTYAYVYIGSFVVWVFASLF